MSNKLKYLITGGCGFIGQNLLLDLVKNGHDVASFDIKASGITGVTSFEGNLNKLNELNLALNNFNPEVIIHLAALKKRSLDEEDFDSIIDTNLKGTFNLFSIAKDLKNLKKMIVVGTAEEYGLNDFPFSSNMREDPISFYSFSKTCGTHLAQLFNKLYNLPVIILRPSIAYGVGQGTDMFIPALINSLRGDRIFEMTEGNQKRQFIYIKDLVAGIKAIISNCEASGQIINITHPENISILDVGKLISRLLNKEEYLRVGGIEKRKLDMLEYNLDTEYLNNKVNFKPKYDLNLGLQEIINITK